jgi:hypothetical protein
MKEFWGLLVSRFHLLSHLKIVSADLCNMDYMVTTDDKDNRMPHKILFSLLRKAYLAAKKCKNRVRFFASRNKVLSPQTIHALKNRKSPLFFFHSENTQPCTVMGEETCPISTIRTIEDANDVCEHIFRVLGSNGNSIGRRIPWHTDFKTGYSWPLKLYCGVIPTGPNERPTEKKLKSDVKIPYELSRFQHLPTLGKAYWLTGDEKYASEFVEEINDWIENNPYPYGVNWTCPMDIGIRVVNWIWGFYFFKDSPKITDQFLLNFLKSLLTHGKHIEGNLERTSRVTELIKNLLSQQRLNLSTLSPAWGGGTNTNHYLSNIVGLVYLGVMFPEFKGAIKWRDFGIKELINEMENQVYPDGVDYEGSTSYHRLVTELFLSATLLCLYNGIAFPKWYLERLERMIEFVMYYIKPDGTAPQVGDNDDGRLHILANYGNWNRLDHRYLLSIGAALSNRSDFKQAGGEFHEEAFWLLARGGLKEFNELPDQKTPVNSKAFVEGGFYIMRRDKLYMIVDCISNERRSPLGHRHNSLLSFELFAYDKTFIVDPGAYIYTGDPEMRNLFRSTTYHNTVVVDGKEQNRFDKNELFKIAPDAAVRVNRWEVTPEYDILSAEHNGYGRLKYTITHQREILFNKTKGFWVIRDILRGDGYHQYDLYFHFAPLEVEFDKEFPLAIKTKVSGANLAVIPLETKGVSVEVKKGWVSYRYGVKEEAPIVKYSQKGIAPASFCNILCPYVESIEIDKFMHEGRSSQASMEKMIDWQW